MAGLRRCPFRCIMGDMSDELAPGFLIAVPHLQDPNFRKGVVLLLERNEDGALGVVINQESPLLLMDLCRDHDLPYSGDPNKRVRSGGPVQPEQGLVLYGGNHRDPEISNHRPTRFQLQQDVVRLHIAVDHPL